MRLLLTCSVLLISASTMACPKDLDWASPGTNEPKITVSAALADASQAFDLKIDRGASNSRCGGQTYYVVNDGRSGAMLAVITVPTAAETADDGRYLMVRVRQLMQTPREQFAAFKAAQANFEADVRELESDLGIGASVPGGYVEDAVTNHGQDYKIMVRLSAGCFDNGWKAFPYYIGITQIKTLEYVAGRADYSPATIYQKGDLRKAVLADAALMVELKKQVLENGRNCLAESHYPDETAAFWQEISRRLSVYPGYKRI